MKLDALHWIQLVVMAIAGGASAVAQGDPALSHIATPIAAAAIGMLGALGLVSRSVVTNVNSGPSATFSAPGPSAGPGIVVKP